MAKAKSEFLHALGVLMAIWNLLIELVRELGGSDEDFHRLTTPAGRSTLAAMAKLIVDAGKSIEQRVRTLTVKHYLTWQQRAVEARIEFESSRDRLYTKGCPDFTEENFPISFDPEEAGTTEYELELVKFDRDIWFHEVVVEFARRKVVRPKVEQALAFMAKVRDYDILREQFPDLIPSGSWSIPVIMLVPEWVSPPNSNHREAVHYVLMLSMSEHGGSYLKLDEIVQRWQRNRVFLAIREKQSPTT